MSVSVSGWVVNGIRLGRPSLRLWLGAGVMMGLAILGWGWLVRLVGRRLLRVLVGWCGCGFRSMRVCRW